jgi:hypothetical protein
MRPKFFGGEDDHGDLVRRKDPKARADMVIDLIQVLDRHPGLVTLLGAVKLEEEVRKLLGGETLFHLMRLGFELLAHLFGKPRIELERLF